MAKAPQDSPEASRAESEPAGTGATVPESLPFCMCGATATGGACSVCWGGSPVASSTQIGASVGAPVHCAATVVACYATAIASYAHCIAPACGTTGCGAHPADLAGSYARSTQLGGAFSANSGCTCCATGPCCIGAPAVAPGGPSSTHLGGTSTNFGGFTVPVGTFSGGCGGGR